MTKIRDIVVTVDRVYLDRILSGEKTIELRKRWTSEPIRTIWFCQKGSGGRIVAKSTVKNVECVKVYEGWYKFRKKIGVSETDYFRYAGENRLIYYVFLENTERVEGVTVKQFGIGGAPQNFAFTRI